MLKAIFWDNDGILVDTEKLYFQASVKALQEIDIVVTKENFIDLSLNQGRSIFDLAVDRGIPQTKITALRAKRDKIFQESLKSNVPIISGVEETLKMLYGKLKMGVVTSSWRSNFEIIHQQTGFLKYFDFSITDDDCENLKPNPEPYLKALEIVDFTPDECLVIEDSKRGLQAANQAGIRCLMIPNELTKSGNFETAFQVCSDIYQAKKAILRLI